MSSMIPSPPPSIQVGGPDPSAGGDPGAGPPPDDSAGGSPADLLKQALKLVMQAADMEQDDIDTSAIHKLAAGISAQIAAEQKLTDDAMGAGPGVKLMRKNTPAAA